MAALGDPGEPPWLALFACSSRMVTGRGEKTRSGERLGADFLDGAILPPRFHPRDGLQQRTRQAAICKANHRVSCADAFAAALAKENCADLVTDDPEFKGLK